jgi:alpha-tubulin suppressor-like RCC1 family protein
MGQYSRSGQQAAEHMVASISSARQVAGLQKGCAMKARRRSWRARRGRRGVLILGLAASAVAWSGAAQAQTAIRGLQAAAVSWGDNYDSLLGNGSGTDSALYGGVSGLGSGVSQVAAGHTFALALKSDGTVWAWGDNGNGQLGDGSNFSSSVPVQVAGLSGVTQVTAGGSTGYALRSDGTVWAWGLNQYGQLGDESLVLSRVPVQVDGLTGVTQIAAGEYFGLALRSDGTVRSWGYNEDGELGDGTSGPEAFTDVPVQVSGLTRVTMIAAGGDNAMAARTQSLYSTLTTLVTWGPDAYGELGTGTSITYTLTPVAVTAIPAGSIRSMSMGGLETAMVLFTDGSVWEWGDPGYGQIPGAPANRGVATPTETMAPGSGITQVSAGYTHVLALRSNGTVLAWGDDDIGQLGNGTTTSVLSGPVQVTGLSNATQVAAGAGYSLAIHETLSIRQL